MGTRMNDLTFKILLSLPVFFCFSHHSSLHIKASFHDLLTECPELSCIIL